MATGKGETRLLKGDRVVMRGGSPDEFGRVLRRLDGMVEVEWNNGWLFWHSEKNLEKVEEKP